MHLPASASPLVHYGLVVRRRESQDVMGHLAATKNQDDDVMSCHRHLAVNIHRLSTTVVTVRHSQERPRPALASRIDEVTQHLDRHRTWMIRLGKILNQVSCVRRTKFAFTLS